MGKEPPFDTWDGEDLEALDVALEDAAEAVAMHVEPDDRRPATGWSDLTGGPDGGRDEGPVTYFDDEQPEGEVAGEPDDGPEPDLEELLERQHYAFPPGDGAG